MNVRRTIWRAFLVMLLVFVGAPLLALCLVAYRYADSAKDVRRVVDAIPASERPIPKLAVDVFLRLNTSGQRGSEVFRMIQFGLYPDDESFRRNAGNWNIRSAVSWLLTPLRLSEEEQATLVWSRSYFGGGAYGLRAGAQKYFKKAPQDLTEEEMVRLWIVTNSPNRYEKDPSSFDDRFAWAMRVWRGELEPGSRMESSQKARKVGG